MSTRELHQYVHYRKWPPTFFSFFLSLSLCSQPCSSKPQILYAWAKDAPKLELPEDVGFRIGKDSDVKYLVLQVHYSSLDHIPADGDDSGIFLKFSHKPMPKVRKLSLLIPMQQIIFLMIPV